MELDAARESQEVVHERSGAPVPRDADLCGIAVASLVLGFIGILVLPCVGSIAGVICGVIGIRQIKRSGGSLRGRPYAIWGIIVSVAPLVLLTLAVSLFAFTVVRGPHLSRANPSGVLHAGRLGNMPAAATEVRAEGWSGIFTGQDYLMFRASPEDINRFLQRAPSLEGCKPIVLGPNRQHLPQKKVSELKTQKEVEEFSNHEWFYVGKLVPKWYNPTIKLRGRKYAIPAEGQHNWGTVIVNDETNTVYIEVIWS